MNVLILGAGRMAYGLVFDFLKNKTIEQITLLDTNIAALEQIVKHFNDSRIKSAQVGADDLSALKPYFKEAQGVLSAVPYDYNFDLTRLAIEQGAHFVDLGGNNTVVDKQFSLKNEAKAMNVGIVPDCGLAPGMVSVVAAGLIDELARVDSLKIRVGGLPLNPQTPLNYMQLFSIHGLINEYIEPAVILEDGQEKTVPSMTDVEELEFPKPFGLLEAFFTSGGTSTLPQTYRDKINYLDYKTIRYPGHCHIMKAMIDLGFTEDEEFEYKGTKLNKRDVFEKMLELPLQYEDDDVALIRITVEGQKSGSHKKIQLQAIEYGDSENGLTAMMRTTAFPAAIILQMLMQNQISDRGVLRQEQAVPPRLFMDELEKRNIRFEHED